RRRGQERGQVGVVLGPRAGARSRPECRRPRMRKRGRAQRFEELYVARVRAGPTAFDVGDAEVVERVRDAQLVLDRKCNVLGLGAVTESGVVKQHLAGHDDACLAAPLPDGCPSPNPSCSTRTASSAYLASTATEILISEVEIIKMLMPSAARSSNILCATPACERMPTPTTDTFAMFSSVRSEAGSASSGSS